MSNKISNFMFFVSMHSNSPDEDRRMLSHIVERWGELSDELKGAVLAVVGSHLLI